MTIIPNMDPRIHLLVNRVVVRHDGRRAVRSDRVPVIAWSIDDHPDNQFVVTAIGTEGHIDRGGDHEAIDYMVFVPEEGLYGLAFETPLWTLEEATEFMTADGHRRLDLRAR